MPTSHLTAHAVSLYQYAVFLASAWRGKVNFAPKGTCSVIRTEIANLVVRNVRARALKGEKKTAFAWLQSPN